jgi:hypothetical protein
MSAVMDLEREVADSFSLAESDPFTPFRPIPFTPSSITTTTSLSEIRMYGLHLPQDQSLPVEVIDSTSIEWMKRCLTALRIETSPERCRRGKALVGLVYYVDQPDNLFSSIHTLCHIFVNNRLMPLNNRWRRILQ